MITSLFRPRVPISLNMLKAMVPPLPSSVPTYPDLTYDNSAEKHGGSLTRWFRLVRLGRR